MFKCKACAAKDAELERARQREVSLVAMIEKLQYALHPARLSPGNASIQASQVAEPIEDSSEAKGDGAPAVSHGTPRNLPPFISGLQYGGHIRPRLVDDLRAREAIARRLA